MASATKIRWKIDTALSTLHLAHSVAVGLPCTDEKIEAALVPYVTEVNNRLLSALVDVPVFWEQLVHESLCTDGLPNACEKALANSGCNELQVDSTSRGVLRQLDECRIAVARRFPRLEDQLLLRAQPLKERWDTVGVGLLNLIGKTIWNDTTPTSWWPARVDGLFVQPIRGGDGGFHSEHSTIWIEAMLTDVEPMVPEVLRAAWLVTRVAIEQHVMKKSGTSPISTTPTKPSDLLPAWKFASVAITMHAGSQLDLTRPNPLAINDAIRIWGLSDDISLGESVAKWWDEFLAAPVPLPIALKALAKQIAF
ncbi:hypothetical protein CA13_13510 [Planctomycetes bacterium CA13]|uniref:Uncharacterized protein n=1 Tax=Novipirellula herctigrandis TaxID=2527986 RepID=A0A5C5YYE1_9BACT|nr:hypothetical protein CA13_13510 [Planctomycetes bacterium CA13]